MKTNLLMFIVILLILFTVPFIGKPWQNNEQSSPKENVTTTDICPVEITVEGVKEPVALEEYVKGVVSAEMPVTFHLEALKAQALAARTYALKRTNYGQQPIAKDVSAQVFNVLEERQKKWGAQFQEYEKKVEQAVKETEGKVVLYDNELITAMFFAASNGKTETAKNFSGSDIPYLQSVESVGEEQVTKNYKEQKSIALAEWNALLGVDWDEESFQSLQLIRNHTGRVQSLIATNYEQNGRAIREKLGLRSTDFNIAFDVTNEQVLIETVGYGHGVGMSQYGAEVLAQQGKTAEQIIAHYYKDTIIEKFENPQQTCLKTP